MCGIFGIVGKKHRLGELIDGLKKLEYRGYDSAGIAYVANGRVYVAKQSGRVAVLEKMYEDRTSTFINVGIAHTRWATHGNPNDINAHPHTDCTGRIAVVHNGIIENFNELKQHLIDSGHLFKSDTDTEIIAHLIEEYYGGDIFDAVKKAIKRLRGAFAIGVVSADEPDKLIAAREGSPLIVGKTEGGGIIASDITPILKYTKEMYFVDDGDIIEINLNEVRFEDYYGNRQQKEPQRIDWEETAAEKSGYKFFMEKEITEEPDVIKKALMGRISEGKIRLDEISEWQELLKKIKTIKVIAAGTSYHSGMVFKYFLNELLPISVEVEISSEFRYMRQWKYDDETLFVFISQSGETLDTLESLRLVKRLGGKTLAISNVVGSTITREAEKTIFINAGPEIGVASTKAYVGQLIVLYLLGATICQAKNCSLETTFFQDLQRMPQLYENALKQSDEIREIAKKYAHFLHFMYIGRKGNYPTAMEGALKLKEISYINATCYAGGELKHGPIALLDSEFPVFVIIPKDDLYQKMKSNVIETRARNARCISLTTNDNHEAKTFSDDVIYIPHCSDHLLPLLCAPYIQLFAYHIADMRGLDVDKPRNLAKSVTVE
jgi:glucosamine--fructose-6-phosphate aminotransferase (isomerizing)